MIYNYVDAHVHLHEFEENEIRILNRKKEFIFLAVSDDLTSSLKTVKLSLYYENIIPAVGIHPCNIENSKEEDIELIKKIVDTSNIRVLGEIGIDNKCKNREKQVKFFNDFINLAKEYDLSLNIHALDNWREIFDILIKNDIKKAYFHWYTGPLDLIDEIVNKGYFIGINPSIKIQKKQIEVLEKLKVENILTESDGPYNYRNIYLHPDLIKDLYNLISSVKNISIENLSEILKRNLSKFII